MDPVTLIRAKRYAEALAAGVEAHALVVVQHGDDDTVARPAAGVVYWMGSVDPTNRELGDWWLETDAYDGS